MSGASATASNEAALWRAQYLDLLAETRALRKQLKTEQSDHAVTLSLLQAYEAAYAALAAEWEQRGQPTEVTRSEAERRACALRSSLRQVQRQLHQQRRGE